MAFPISLDGLQHTQDGVTNADSLLFDAWIDAINNLEAYVGIASIVQNASGTLTERINFLLNAPGGIVKQATTPSSPAANDLWIDTSVTTRPLRIFYSAAYHLVGANALALQGFTVHTTTPADGQVLTWDNTNSRWAPATATGGLASPFVADGDTMYAAPTTHAPARLAIGTPGQIYAVSSGTPPLPTWITAPYIPIPSSANVGAVLVKNASGVWVGVDPGTTGYALTSNGSGAMPTYQAIPVTPPGASITAPAGLRVGSLIQYDGSAFIAITPGTAGQYLTSHGDTNASPAALLTWTTNSALVNPMTAIGSLIKADTGGAPIELARPATSGDWPDSFLGVTGGSPGWRKLGGAKVDTYLDYLEQGSDPAAIVGGGLLYTKTDHHLYYRESGGAVHDLLATGSGYNTIQDEGTPLTTRTTVDFQGAAVTASDNGSKTIVSIPGYTTFGASGGSHSGGLVPDPGASAGTTRFLREDATWQTAGGGGGGGGSRLALSSTGLLYYINFRNFPDQALPSAANGSTGPDGWYVHNTNDQGTWELVNGLLIPTSNGAMDRCRRDSATWLNAIYEYGMWRNASLHIGGRQAVGTNADYDQLIRNLEWQVNYGAGGTYGTSISQGGAVRTPSNLYSRHKLRINWTGTQRLLSNWENRRARLNAFLSASGPTAVGGIGAIAYQAQLAVGLTDYAVYTDTKVTVTGLSGTQAWQLFAEDGTLLGSSGTQSGGSASVDTAPNGANAVCDFPLYGSIQVYTDNTYATPSSGNSRFPVEGEALIWGGNSYLFT